MGSQSVHKGRKKDDDGELIEFPHFFSRLNKRAVIPSRIERDRAELVWPETKKATRHSSNPARRCCQRPVSRRANRRNSAISARDHPANRKRAKRRAPTRTNTHTHTHNTSETKTHRIQSEDNTLSFVTNNQGQSAIDPRSASHARETLETCTFQLHQKKIRTREGNKHSSNKVTIIIIVITNIIMVANISSKQEAKNETADWGDARDDAIP